ncbi:G2/mitotic-specific cyclin-A [Drosophila sulfurigaster albostrigata]|uniref:G2/mitotic-specific cyclin-A n=1 Tax=Drosophila sulfurigaster albostrigata TaxID=89887 RepID=UPI002D21BFB5|nr:G2/mitotic-specific cyclin-A [Drosophila sulfurigaster albostrigata]
MASFQIHRDINGKENPNIMNLKEKAVLGAGGKQQIKANVLAPRANSGVLATNNTNVPRGIPAPSGKAPLRDLGVENAGYGVGGGPKKSNAVPVEQFKTFSVYEDNIDTQVQLQSQLNANAADKENIQKDNGKFESMPKQHGFQLDNTPMSVTDVLSPMSVDRSIAEANTSLTEDMLNASDASVVAKAELMPRNDRQRFFEVVQYQQDILENFRESEKKHRPKPQYMRRQTDINHSMRAILVDWLVEVAEEYKLDTETLYLTVSYLDRFLSHMSVKRAKLQLVGTAAMYVAAKYEEVYPPNASEFVFLTDDSYTQAQVLRMEQVFLKILTFNLSTPTPYVFMTTYGVMSDMPEKLKSLALYICELSLLEGETYMQYLPSLMSSASLALARHILGMQMWTPELEKITTYSLEQLMDVVVLLCKTHKGAKDLSTQAIQEKYKRDKYKKVANIESIQLSKENMEDLLQAYKAACSTDLLFGLNEDSKVDLFYKF